MLAHDSRLGEKPMRHILQFRSSPEWPTAPSLIPEEESFNYEKTDQILAPLFITEKRGKENNYYRS